MADDGKHLPKRPKEEIVDIEDSDSANFPEDDEEDEEEELNSQSQSSGSGSGSTGKGRGVKGVQMAPDSTDRKKATHLRCERQRREAINSGYADLKQLLPSHLSPLGCKTTNASILYRACDYIRQLQAEEQRASEEKAKLSAQAMALQIIARQYQQIAIDQEQTTTPGNPASPICLKYKMFQDLMMKWFASYSSQVDTASYPEMTRTVLSWLENGINFEEAVGSLPSSLYNTR